MPSSTAASRAISGEPTTSVTRWTLFSGSSTTISTSALSSISTTGSRIVTRVAAKLGRRSRSSDGRCGIIFSGGSMSTQRAAYRAKTGPAMITVGMATSTPSASVTPRLASRASIATSGPGCGGMSPCITESPASAGIPIRIREKLPRLATSSTTGIISTIPTSKKSGRPMIEAMRTIAHGMAPRLAFARMVSTIWSAPPESASSLPRMAPSAMSTPTLATVEPRPAVKLAIVSAGAAPAKEPSARDPMVSARNACILSLVIRRTMTAMPASTAMPN